jgi:methylamine--corrinoid protein Co-methyltransferase
MTKMSFYEYSAWIIGTIPSGGSIEIGPSAKGTAMDYNIPMSSLLGSEVAHAAVGLSRREANGIVDTLLKKYEDKLPDPPIGKKYQECYDEKTGKPGKELIELYREVRRELADQFGLQFKHISPYIG